MKWKYAISQVCSIFLLNTFICSSRTSVFPPLVLVLCCPPRDMCAQSQWHRVKAALSCFLAVTFCHLLKCRVLSWLHHPSYAKYYVLSFNWKTVVTWKKCNRMWSAVLEKMKDSLEGWGEELNNVLYAEFLFEANFWSLKAFVVLILPSWYRYMLMPDLAISNFCFHM